MSRSMLGHCGLEVLSSSLALLGIDIGTKKAARDNGD